MVPMVIREHPNADVTDVIKAKKASGSVSSYLTGGPFGRMADSLVYCQGANLRGLVGSESIRVPDSGSSGSYRPFERSPDREAVMNVGWSDQSDVGKTGGKRPRSWKCSSRACVSVLSGCIRAPRVLARVHEAAPALVTLLLGIATVVVDVRAWVTSL
jgi:hypothetical protein